MVFDHEADYPSQWAAIGAIATKSGCTPSSPQLDPPGRGREGTTNCERERIKAVLVEAIKRSSLKGRYYILMVDFVIGDATAATVQRCFWLGALAKKLAG